MKELQDKIDSIIYWLTEPNGGNAVDESDIRDAKVELKELKEQLRLHNVSQQRELLKALADNFNESTHTYVGQPMIEETLKAFNCG